MMDESTLVQVADLIDSHVSTGNSVAKAKKILRKRERKFRKLDERLSKFMLDNFHGKIVVRGNLGYIYDDMTDGFLEYPVVFTDDVDFRETDRKHGSVNPDVGMDLLTTFDGIAEGKITL